MEAFDDTGNFTSIVSVQRRYQLCTVAAVAVLVYDVLLTLGDESRYIRGWRLTTILYLVNRYIEIASCIPVLMLLFPVSDMMCVRWSAYEVSCILLPYFAWAWFSAVRVYALTGRKVFLAITVFILNVTFMIPDIYLLSHVKYLNGPAPYNCGSISLIPVSGLTLVLLASRATALLGELIVIVVTVRYTYTRSLRRSHSPNSDDACQALRDVVLNNGIACFSIPLIFNVAISALMITRRDTIIFEIQALRAIRDSISSILISRFLLDLGKLSTEYNTSTRNNGSNSMLTTYVTSNLSDITDSLDIDQSSG